MNDDYEIDIYATETGKEPYSDWKDTLDEQTLAKIDIRLTRIRHSGHLGDFDSVGEGVYTAPS